MNWLEFIFSSRARYRLMRHGIFWLAWWWYFYSFSFLLKSPSNTSGLLENPLWIWKLHELLLSFYLVLIQMITVYTITHYLLPRLLEDHRTFKFIFSVAILALLMTVSCHVVYQYFYPQGADYNIPFNSRNRNNWWPSFYAGPLNALKIIAAAVSIKLFKRWWLAQQRAMKLRTEKINAELQLLKAKVHPGFLFNTLNNIYEYAVAGSPTAAVMLLKLSDLLSYMLYECDQDWIPLDREIAMMNEYIELEKLRMDEEFEMVVQVKGVTTDKQVPPLLLLPFIENSFRLSTLGNGKKWMSMELMVEEKIYSLRIINGIPANYTYDLEVAGYGISTVQRRLQLLCPGRHELKMYAEQEMFVTNFKVQFIEAPYNHDSYGSGENRKKMANHAGIMMN